MAQVWELDLDHSEQIVLLAMADHAHDDGTDVRPSIERIAWKTGYSKRSVQRVVTRLKQSRLIMQTQPANWHQPAVYRIAVENGTQKAPFAPSKRGDNLTPQTEGRGDTGDAVGVTPVSFRSDTAMSPKPSRTINEPSVNKILDQFESIWIARPRRAGSDPKKSARRAYRARLKEGHTFAEIQAGYERYRAFCEATGKIGTEWVLRALTFLGPDDHFLNQWEIPKRGNESKLSYAERCAAAARRHHHG